MDLERKVCEICGKMGKESPWPGNDPANIDADQPILCVDTNGHLICDDCAADCQEEEE